MAAGAEADGTRRTQDTTSRTQDAQHLRGLHSGTTLTPARPLLLLGVDVVVDGEAADAERARHRLHAVPHGERATRFQYAHDLLLGLAVELRERHAPLAFEGGQDAVERVGELGQAYGDDVLTLPGQHDVIDAGPVGRQHLAPHGVDQRLDRRDERRDGGVAPGRGHRSPSPAPPRTFTWSEIRVAPASRVLRSSASTAASTVS